MRSVCLLGASGSIGRQTLDVLKTHPEDFILQSFSVGHQVRKISYILKAFPSVKSVYLIDDKKAKQYQKRYPSIRFYSGENGITDLLEHDDSQMVVNALVGFAGLKPTLETLKENKICCLANKESLVVGGELVNQLLKEGHGTLFPIDSEHSALYKCLKVDPEHVNRLILTASGGAFRKLNRDQLKSVTPEDALNHPTWKMGKKITIDCATMVNKAFEVIEAHYLYQYPSEKIDILLHDESYIHSLVQYENGFYRGEANKPDMRNPIRYALSLGEIPFKTFYTDDLSVFKSCHFHPFVLSRYPEVRWAKTVIDEKGLYGAIFNASNEIAVGAFLAHQISFLDIETIIDYCMEHAKNKKHPTFEEIVLADASTRSLARELVRERNKKAL